ncbi:MAG: hypothetical protein IIA87_03625 [Nanoarchaeota archaeon]|nr:hypothetical protein [Nanoarchaeota archaeon]
MVIIHKQTRQRVVADRFNTDIVFDAKSQSDALNVDVIPVIGGWTDQTGTGGPPTKQQLFFAGIADKFFGTDVWLERASLSQLDNLGNRTETTRQRQRRIFMDLKNQPNF